MKLTLKTGAVIYTPINNPLCEHNFVAFEFNFDDMQELAKLTPYEKVRYFEMLNTKIIKKE